MEALKGKGVVITGGSSGIGLATAKRFVAEGAFVFITGRRQAELDKAAKEIGRNVVAVKCDVSRLEDLDHLYKEVAARKSTIDIVFVNAGMVESVETPAATPEHFDTTFNTNARGAYFTVQKALPLLNDGASIILTGSVVWHKGMPIYGSYAATKAALRSYVRRYGQWIREHSVVGANHSSLDQVFAARAHSRARSRPSTQPACRRVWNRCAYPCDKKTFRRSGTPMVQCPDTVPAA